MHGGNCSSCHRRRSPCGGGAVRAKKSGYGRRGHPCCGRERDGRASRRGSCRSCFSRLERARAERAAGLADEGRSRTGGARGSIRRCHVERGRRHRGVGAVQFDAGGGHGARGSRPDYPDHRRCDSFGQARMHCHGAARTCWRDPGHRSLECADHSGRSRNRGAARLRQHGGAQSLGTVSANPFSDRRSLHRGWFRQRDRQSCHQCAQGCRRDRGRTHRSSRPSGGSISPARRPWGGSSPNARPSI